LYYEVDNRELRLRPGQRVGIDLAITSVTDARVVPMSAVLYDIYGGTWVYVTQPKKQNDQQSFSRHRVLIEWVDAEHAILSEGPQAGASVVVAGAAELFGTEFGAGK
jgi:multidrug efflux pump subunit AcrA (membrane-fusion protein)